MPFSTTIDDAHGLVRISASGDVSADAWFAALAEAFADPRYRPGFDLLYDRTALSHVPDADDVRLWIDDLSRVMHEAGAGRLAVVVAQPVVYGMMRMAGAFASRLGFGLMPYWSEAEALAALEAYRGEQHGLAAPPPPGEANRP